MNDRKQALEALRDQVKAGEWIDGPEMEPYPYYAQAAFNGSVDAAISLMQGLLPGWMVYNLHEGTTGTWHAQLNGDTCDPKAKSYAFAEMPSRAMLLAILSALISETPDTPKGETP